LSGGRWDGSDIFCSTSRRWIPVTTRVRESPVAAQISNVEFQRVLDVERIWTADGSLLH